MLYENSSKGKEESVLLRIGLSHAIHYIQFKIITFPGQNQKVFKGWRVVTTYEVFIDCSWFADVNLYLFISEM